MTEQVEQLTGTLLDDLAAMPQGTPVDLREHLAYRLPIQVIARLLGLPDSLTDSFRTTVDRVFDTTRTAEEAVANLTTSTACWTS